MVFDGWGKNVGVVLLCVAFVFSAHPLVLFFYSEKKYQKSAALCPIAPRAKGWPDAVVLRRYAATWHWFGAYVVLQLGGCALLFGDLCFGAAGSTSTTSKGAIKGWAL